MPIEVQGDATKRLLEEAATGNEEAKNALFKHVYDELHDRVHARMRRERVDHSLGTTGLLHEVYLHLIKSQGVFTKNRSYFFGAAARAMDQLLREHARKRIRRPQGHIDPEGHIRLDEVIEEVESTLKVDVVDLMNALDELKETGKHGPRRHDVVRLRIWGGLTYQQIAEDLEVDVTTVERDWLAARAWLFGRLKGSKTND